MSSDDGLQFQTVHGRRRVWVFAVWAPLLPLGIYLGGALAGDASLPLGFYGALIGIEYLGLVAWLARRNSMGIIVRPSGVKIASACETALVKPAEVDRSPEVGFKHYRGISYVTLIDAHSYEHRVASMVRAGRGYPLHRILPRANSVLVREVTGGGKAKSGWQNAGIEWRDDNDQDVRAFLMARIGELTGPIS